MNYNRCKRCVMDNKADSYINFNEDGICNYCTEALSKKDDIYFPNEEGQKKLNNMLKKLKENNKHQKYDCLMGISGGLDSSYLAYLGAAKWGLRILAVHIDDGYDTDISKSNINKLCKKANIDMIVIRPDFEQFNDLTRAYILARVPNLAVPQDNILFAAIYNFAKEYKIKTFLSGGNFALESILQRGNTINAYDLANLKDIHKKFGSKPINKLPTISDLHLDINRWLLNLKTLRPLNYIDYNREKALKELNDYCDFEYYGSKHLENTLTKFIQTYWLPNKYGVDKRTSHYSSMIVSNQLSREEALKLLEKPLYDESIYDEIDIILNKIKLSKEKFDEIMKMPSKQHTDYKTSNYVKIRRQISRFIKR